MKDGESGLQIARYCAMYFIRWPRGLFKKLRPESKEGNSKATHTMPREWGVWCRITTERKIPNQVHWVWSKKKNGSRMGRCLFQRHSFHPQLSELSVDIHSQVSDLWSVSSSGKLVRSIQVRLHGSRVDPSVALWFMLKQYFLVITQHSYWLCRDNPKVDSPTWNFPLRSLTNDNRNQ